ncbi:TetR family transcriptional regulator [Weissella oryzae SG25]|uniref:TetR family transcriptional regulator n=1 Tax=Weissella oryzae (strain DSM 25784 / JCM 18191 / LMG 30913 / SG25) TaxID=1329250 RepID=A0A069CR21_WEIOS|nr:hypothetical protein [Weissella oryzae]GAK30180.1 TetR family transcriptional regulator [Weissella oryzae SG25]
MPKAFIDEQLKLDPRILKSQHALHNALVHFYNQGYAFNALSISMVTDKAKIARSTFYRHHTDLADIIVIDFFSQIYTLQQAFDKLPKINFERTGELIIDSFLAHQIDFKLALWAGIEGHIIDIFAGEFIKIVRLQQIQLEQTHFHAYFFAAALFNFGQLLANDQTNISKNTAYRLYKQLIPKLN